MTHPHKQKIRDWSKFIGVGISGIALGAVLLGVPKCSELQTVAAAEKRDASIEKTIAEEKLRQKEEHKDFREAIQKTNEKMNANMETILQHLIKR